MNNEKQKFLPWRRWGVLGIIMLGTFMAILDANIVNVAMPHMMSSFGVDRNKIEWVATGFMLTSASIMPFMGWVTCRINYKIIYLGCLGIFTIASGLCAFAWNYESLVAARILQALGGGAIQPIGMSIVAELFEPHERGKALGIWGMGIMVAPAIGPTLGGYLTDEFGWRSIFSINLPIGILTLLLGFFWMWPIHARTGRRPFDIAGYFFLVMFLVGSLTALSNGQEKGWDSDYIRICEAFATIGIVMFISIELAVKHPILNLNLFLIRNYCLSVLLSVFRAVGLFGSVFLFPLFLQLVMGYTPIQAGMWMMPNAIAVGVMMPVAGRLADKYSPKILTIIGSIAVGSSLIVFGNLDPMSQWPILVLPQIVRGIGLALLLSPLLAAALNAVPRDELPMASSFLNVSQNIGGALGIALLNNHLTEAIHFHAVRLGEALPPQSAECYRLAFKAAAIKVYRSPGMLADVTMKTVLTAEKMIYRNAQVLGFNNSFFFGGLILLACIPLCFLLKPAAHHVAGKSDAKMEIETENQIALSE
ncbi:MAG TPA: DHA2 family efflux MFS transporter permease subunit, partial [Candidatus Wallbacteria bacterium]|nr:DHA2 family efflux MFS transporter permease subunit [Candidatus Wallbacteria bacterium]